MTEWSEGICRDHRDQMKRDLTHAVEAFDAALTRELGHVRKSIDGLAKQVEITNGRVRIIEVWKGTLRGAHGVVLIVVPVLTALLVVLLNYVLK